MGLDSRCRHRAVLGCTLLLLVLGFSTASPTKSTPVEDPSKAPLTVVPTAYSIDLQAINSAEQDKNMYNLTGTVAITVTCRDPTDKVHLSAGPSVHVLDNALLTSTLTGDQPVTILRHPSGMPWVTLQLPKTLKADHSYQLKMNFTRQVVTEVTLDNWPRHYFVALLIEPGQAAEFFPVFNSSSYKVPMDINITHLLNYTSLAASRVDRKIKVLERKFDRDWELTVFSQTRPINIRQLSVFVADFRGTNESVNRRTDVLESGATPPPGWEEVRSRAWGRPNFANALTVFSQLLPNAICHIQCYMGIPYPTNQLEVVALPFYSGAPMIASSLAYLRESEVQFDPNLDGMLLRVSRVIAEQYIGVHVTPAPAPSPAPDTRQVPVSAALVNYVAAETVRYIKPREIQNPNLVPPEQRLSTTTATPPTTVTPASPATANGTGKDAAKDKEDPCGCLQYESDKSDILVNGLYSVYYELGSQFPLSGLTSQQRPSLQAVKAELVIRMLAITLGEKTFKAALKSLLTEKENSFYSPEDLWRHMTEHAYASDSLKAPLNVKVIAASWIEKDRFPLLTVTRDNDNGAKLQQKVFRRRNYTPEERDLEKENAMVWDIPIVTLTEGQKFSRLEQPPRLWMTQKTTVLENASVGDSFLVVNPEETAPCIVNYDKRNWELLSNALNDRKEPVLPPRTRAKLLHDAVMLAHAGDLPFGEALPLLRSLERETSPAVWQPIGNVLDHVRRDVEGTRLEDRFNTFLESILRAALKNVKDLIAKGHPCQCQMRQLNESRALILQQLSRADMQPCISRAREAYKPWAASEDPDKGIPMADSLMCCLFQWGEPQEFEFGVQRLLQFPASRQRAERAFLLRVLAGCPRQPERKLRIMNVTILENNGTFSEEDQRLVLQMVSTRGHDLLKFMEDNWDAVKAKFESQQFMWEHLVSRATGSLKTKDDLAMLKKLYAKRTGAWGVAETIVQQSIKRAESNVAWADEAFPSMEAWLDKYLVNHRKD